jgi:hypothetical protein
LFLFPKEVKAAGKLLNFSVFLHAISLQAFDFFFKCLVLFAFLAELVLDLLGSCCIVVADIFEPFKVELEPGTFGQATGICLRSFSWFFNSLNRCGLNGCLLIKLLRALLLLTFDGLNALQFLQSLLFCE